jgi:3-oxoadipate enol-lactonase
MRLEYRLDGLKGAPVLVLSHSVGTTSDLWESAAPAWTGAFRVLRYDHRGHGGSDAPPGPYSVEALAGDLLELLDELGFERVSLCGLSLGGAVGMWLAVNAPERIDRLVLACTSARFGKPEPWLERARIVRAEGLESIADAVVAGWFTSEFARWRPEVVERFREIFVATPAEGYAASCEALGAWDFRHDLDSIRSATLVVAGSDDTRVPLDDARFLRDRIPGASLVVLPEAPHLASVVQPEAFAAVVTQHLSDVLRPASPRGQTP